MSEQNLSPPQGEGENKDPTSTSCSEPRRRRREADSTLKDQDPVQAYLATKQTRGLMSESEKRLLAKMAAVCGLSLPLNR